MMKNDSKTYELLGEIAKLLKKYGKETFLEVATILRNPHILSLVADSLENIAKIPPKNRGAQRRPTPIEERTRFRESLVAIGKTEPEKSKILLLLFDLLQNKTILPSFRELIDFVGDQGLPLPKTKSRYKVIISLVKICIDFSLTDLQAFTATINLHQPHDNTDRSLEDWGKVILDR